MTFEEFWKAILARNPTLQRRDAMVPIEQARRIAKQAYEIAAKTTVDRATTLANALFSE